MTQALLTLTDTNGQVLELAWQDLQELPANAHVADVSTLLPKRQGAAVRLKELLTHSKVWQDGAFATVRSTTGDYSACVPLGGLAEALLLYRLGDAPLPASHGGPFRLMIPDAAACRTADIDACANVKDVGSIEISNERQADHRPGPNDPHRREVC